MRRWLVVVSCLVGCGRLGFDGAPEPGDNGTTGVDNTDVSRSPFVCESIGSLATTNTSDVNLAVATTPSGASVFWVSSAGSPMYGFDLASTSHTSSPAIQVSNGSFDQVGAAYIDGFLIATGRSTIRALVHEVPTPMAAGTEIANMWGDHIGKAAVVHASTDRVMAASCSEVALHSFDPTTWVGTEDGYVNTSPSASDHLDITQLASSAFTVVSLADACSYTVATSRTTGTTRVSPVRCQEARVTASGDQVAMAYEENATVDLVVDDASTVTAANSMPIGAGTSPRVLFVDGRLWVSYLDDTGAMIAGYVDNGILRAVTIANATASHDGYELAVVDGAPWIIGVDATRAIYGRRLCAPTP